MKVLLDMIERNPPTACFVSHHGEDGRLHLSVTNRCNLNCRHCPKQHWSGYGGQGCLEREPSLAEMIDAICGTGNCREVIFSGVGEPTHRLYEVLEVARRLKHKGVKVHLYTDGLANRVHGRSVVEDMEGNVDSLTVLLNAHDAESYIARCQPAYPDAFDSIVEFIARAREFVPEITASVMAGMPAADLSACRDLARRLGIGFQERPVGEYC